MRRRPVTQALGLVRTLAPHAKAAFAAGLPVQPPPAPPPTPRTGAPTRRPPATSSSIHPVPPRPTWPGT